MPRPSALYTCRHRSLLFRRAQSDPDDGILPSPPLHSHPPSHTQWVMERTEARPPQCLARGRRTRPEDGRTSRSARAPDMRDRSLPDNSSDSEREEGVSWHNKKPAYRLVDGLLERKRRFELPTLSLARRCSTTEPLPHAWGNALSEIHDTAPTADLSNSGRRFCVRSDVSAAHQRRIRRSGAALTGADH